MATYAYDQRYTSGHQAPPGHVTAVVHKQYNSPMPLYSMDNIADTLVSQAQVLTNGAVGVDFHALSSPVLQKSQVYRMLQEQEGRVERVTPSPTPRPDSPPTTFQSQSFIRIQKTLGDTEDEPTPPTNSVKFQDIRKPSPLAVEWPPPSHQRSQQQPQQQYQPTGTGQFHPSIAAHRAAAGIPPSQQYRQQAADPVSPGIVQQQYRPQVTAQPLHSPPITGVQQQQYRPQVAAQPPSSPVTTGAPQQYRSQVTAQPLTSPPQQQQPPVAVSPAYHPTVAAHQLPSKARQGAGPNVANGPPSHTYRQSAPAPASAAECDLIPIRNPRRYDANDDANDMGESSPRVRHRPVWPPQDHRQYLQTSTQSMHFTASKASKKFVWPPPREYTSYEYEEYQQQSPKLSRRDAQRRADGFLPGPTRVVRVQPRSPARLAAEAWQPYSGAQNEHHVRFAPGSAPSRRFKSFEDVIHQSNATRLPPTYRPPPGTQHVVFESEEED